MKQTLLRSHLIWHTAGTQICTKIVAQEIKRESAVVAANEAYIDISMM